MTPASSWGPAQRERERTLLIRLQHLSPDAPERSALRDELVIMHLPLVRHLAARYRGRGESLDDLVQIGTVGLIASVDRYDPSRGTEFSTFATPTILGEIKRHFRDRTWAVSVPRRLQELSVQVTARVDTLSHDLGRMPTVRELADALDIEPDLVLEALEAGHAYATDTLSGAEEQGSPDTIGTALLDPAFDEVEDRESLRPLIEGLPDLERSVVVLRFFRGMSQAAIGEEVGISQMQVSRLLARALTSLREALTAA